MDCMNGDATLFTRSDEVQAAWTFVDGITAAWEQAGAKQLPQYAPGSWGPPEMDEFIQSAGFTWRNTD
jgi:glucose-6-phosphate 1-dehydrogenase